jgi:hypothetical protein
MARIVYENSLQGCVPNRRSGGNAVMLKLIVATVAGLFAVFFIFGDEARREEASLTKRGPAFEFSLAAFIAQPEVIDAVELAPASAMSDVEAVKIAVEAGDLLRAKRSGTYQGDIVTAASAATSTVSGGDTATNGAQAINLWYVSGTRVNLRAGPGTGNEVVARLARGTKADVLSDTGADWIEIRTADGTAGWISSKFLTEAAPG